MKCCADQGQRHLSSATMSALGYFLAAVLLSFATTIEAGCDGIPSSTVAFDRCGVCGGKNDCFCDRNNETLRSDSCGYCGVPDDGFWNRCVGCDGLPNSGRNYDACGVCGGLNDCRGCDGIPGSKAVRDACGVCAGTNSTCLGCDGVPKSAKVNDRCGVCGGANECDKCKQTVVCDMTCDLTTAGSVPLFCECARKHVLCIVDDKAAQCEPLLTLCGSDTLRATYAAQCPDICKAIVTTLASTTTESAATTTETSSSVSSSVSATIMMMVLYALT